MNEEFWLPELALERIFEFYALKVDSKDWVNLICVCKQWRKLAIPIFTEVFNSMFPRFVKPLEDDTAERLVYNLTTMRHVTLNRLSDYAWSFLRPIPLNSIGSKGISTKFVVSLNGGVMIAIFIGNRLVIPPKKLLLWNPDYGDPTLKPSVSTCVCSFGCFSGDFNRHFYGSNTKEKPDIETESIGDHPNCEFCFHLSKEGKLSVWIPQMNRKVSAFIDKTEESSKELIDNLSCDPSIVLCFAIGIANSGISATISPFSWDF